MAEESGLIDEHGQDAIQDIMAGAAKEQPQKSPPSLDERDAGDDPGLIPPRGWLLGNQFCRRFLSSIVAAGGTGKTALRLLPYISAATGRELTGQHVFRRFRVLLLSFEDDMDELQRRVAAALIHHRVDRSELKGWLFYAAPKGLKLAETRTGGRQAGDLEKLLREAIVRRKPDIIGLDPFVKLQEQITVPMPGELRAFVERIAAREDRTVAGVIRHMVAEAARREAEAHGVAA
jgi:hypothetical protein